MREVALTTTDNPYNPFKDFENWFKFDLYHGYNSLSYVARLAFTSDELPEEYNNMLREQAIDDICELNVCGKYKKIYNEETIDEKPSVQKSLEVSEVSI